MIHKDLADGGGLTAFNTLDYIRETPQGENLRTIIISGEFSYKDTCLEAKNKLKADAGYDPINPHNGYLPKWMVEFIKLGPVSDQERKLFRGKAIIINENEAIQRKTWLEFNKRRGIEKE
ncbi:hypothetical protein COT75_03710 [Candidatus Beckwithbacteria bacterium CG10_big_fil_rev_8_21_14_0_10_34_10]|uniref:Uncharacterized protein n=1 Tax=Candidatus Beckwithbacteria bacterium CG10_big_fil_rev_8_21_14_0_10_34_10 TaxID=1974495 RepID=A0A2H0W8F6_9BACT|nr:MAG: hypothetical protein COT75_03710 [Candidatus Beckwithbacteria bacterium CG10_big_fil_rev_8_21_14_0_10_34_10]